MEDNYERIIRSNKIKKLILISIAKYINHENIWDLSSQDFSVTTGYPLNSLKLKELFCKEILHDLNSNNFGFDENTVEKFKSLSKEVTKNSQQYDCVVYVTEQMNSQNNNEYLDGNTNEVDPLSNSESNIMLNSPGVLRQKISYETIEDMSYCSDNYADDDVESVVQKYYASADHGKFSSEIALNESEKFADIPVAMSKPMDFKYLSQDSENIEKYLHVLHHGDLEENQSTPIKKPRKSLENHNFSTSNEESENNIIDINALIDIIDNDSVNKVVNTSSVELEMLLETNRQENPKETDKAANSKDIGGQPQILDKKSFAERIKKIQNELDTKDVHDADGLQRILDENFEFISYVNIPCARKFSTVIVKRPVEDEVLMTKCYMLYLKEKSKFDDQKSAITCISVRDSGTHPITFNERNAYNQLSNDNDRTLLYFKYNHEGELSSIGKLEDMNLITTDSSTHSIPYDKTIDSSVTKNKIMVDAGNDEIGHLKKKVSFLCDILNESDKAPKPKDIADQPEILDEKSFAERIKKIQNELDSKDVHDADGLQRILDENIEFISYVNIPCARKFSTVIVKRPVEDEVLMTKCYMLYLKDRRKFYEQKST